MGQGARSMNELLVVNKFHGKWPSRRYIDIGGHSPLRDTTRMDEGRTRAEAVWFYGEYLREQMEAGNEAILNELERIGAMVLDDSGEPVCLQCFCAPKACHGDVIKRVIEEAIKATTEIA
jgi:hypothetical protein